MGPGGPALIEGIQEHLESSQPVDQFIYDNHVSQSIISTVDLNTTTA